MPKGISSYTIMAVSRDELQAKFAKLHTHFLNGTENVDFSLEKIQIFH